VLEDLISRALQYMQKEGYDMVSCREFNEIAQGLSVHNFEQVLAWNLATAAGISTMDAQKVLDGAISKS